MLRLVTAPTTEPVTLAEVKAFCGIPHDLDDQLLTIMISAAREHGESITGRSWAEKTLEVVLDRFPVGTISLPATPISSVSSIEYVDANGVEQALPESEYHVDAESMIGRVAPKNAWPETASQLNAVRVQYSAGWTPEEFPQSLRQWLLMRVETLYGNRDALVMVSNGRLVMPLNREFVDGLLDEHNANLRIL